MAQFGELGLANTVAIMWCSTAFKNANRGTVRGQIDERKHIRANPQHSALAFDRLINSDRGFRFYSSAFTVGAHKPVTLRANMNIVDKHCFMTQCVRKTVLVFPSYTFAVYTERLCFEC